jgi:hypothetical protein
VVFTVPLEEKLVNQIIQKFHNSIEFTQLDSLETREICLKNPGVFGLAHSPLHGQAYNTGFHQEF